MASISIAARPRAFKSSRSARIAGAAFFASALALAPHARADTVTNLAYPSIPASWHFYNASAGGAPTAAPDGTRTGVVVNATTNGGGIVSPASFPVAAGTVYTSSKYLRISNGPPEVAACVSKTAFSGAISSPCLVFNAVTGAFISIDPLLADYTIAPVAQTGWWRVSVTFKPTATVNLAVADFSGGTGTFETWGEQLETGPYQSQLVPTTTGPASGVNQIDPQADNINNWVITGTANVSAVTGRAGVTIPSSWLFSTNTTAAQFNITTVLKQNVIYYSYMYVLKSTVSGSQEHPYLSLVLNNNGDDYAEADINADSLSGVALLRIARFGINAPPGAYLADQGVFNAGDYWGYWAKVVNGNFTDAFARLFIQPQSNGFNVTIGRVGLQEGGVFP